MDNSLALGVDIGGTNVAFGLTDYSGELLLEQSLNTASFHTAEEMVNTIYDNINNFSKGFNLVGIGIGAPNGNYFNGTIEFAPNLKWDGIIPLVSIFEDRFNSKAILTNDANAAAIGEMIYGSARDLKDFVTITLGTGCGSGIIVNRQLVYGHDGFAGEYGHVRVVTDGRLCGCGRRGCLETYASATGVVRSINEFDSENKESSRIFSIENPSATDVFRIAKEGDAFCKDIIEYTAKILGEALADFACFSSPEAYILFGGIAQNGPEFKNLVKKYMETALLNIYKNKIDIRVSNLHDKNAAILGASSLVWNQLS